MNTCTIDNTSICRKEVFAEIFNKQFKALRNYLFYRFGNSEQVADTAQEAFIALWQNCASVTYDGAIPYLYRVAQNKSINLKHHEKVVLTYEKSTREKTEHQESPQFLMEEKQFKEKLLKAVANLSEPQRVAFLMNRIDKLKYTEIAEKLDISVKAVEKRIHLAMKSLKDELKTKKL